MARVSRVRASTLGWGTPHLSLLTGNWMQSQPRIRKSSYRHEAEPEHSATWPGASPTRTGHHCVPSLGPDLLPKAGAILHQRNKAAEGELKVGPCR